MVEIAHQVEFFSFFLGEGDSTHESQDLFINLFSYKKGDSECKGGFLEAEGQGNLVGLFI